MALLGVQRNRSVGRLTAAAGSQPVGTVFQTFEGVMTHQRNFDDSHVFNNFNAATGKAATTMTTAQEDAVLDALYVELGLTAVETFFEAPIQATIDGPFDFTGLGGKAGSGVAALTARVRSRVPASEFVSFFAPAFRESWMGTETAAYVTRYSLWLLAQLQYMVDNGNVITHYAVGNEPTYGTSNFMTGPFIRDVIKDLTPRLAAAGLSSIKLSATCDVRSSATATTLTPVFADATSAAKVTSISTHLYDEGISALAALTTDAATRGLPLWMTEWSRAVENFAPNPPLPVMGELAWPYLLDQLFTTYNCTLAAYQIGFFGAWQGASTLISLNIDGSANYTGFTKRREFFYTGQWSRDVKPGATRVALTSTNANVRPQLWFKGTKRTLIVSNFTASAQTVTITAADLAGVTAMPGYRTSASEDWVATTTPTASAGSVTVTVPASSVSTFVGTAA